MGFQLPSCPSSSAPPSGREHADPAHQVGLCEAGSWPFPWAPGMNLELLDAVMNSEVGPRECVVSSPDVSLRFLELCIRMQTSTSWMIHSVQWMQESADTCSNSEFAPVFLSSLLSRNPVEIGEESSGKPLCFRRLSSLCPGVPPSPPFPP